MKREIEFRGKHTHMLSLSKVKFDNTWVYGHLSAEDYISVTYPDGTYAEKYINKDTVGQYIGKQDKNKNRIYELDIVELNYPDTENLHWLVVFENGEFHLTSKYPDIDERLVIENYKCSWETIKVIGNYIDNPEMLEG